MKRTLLSTLALLLFTGSNQQATTSARQPSLVTEEEIMLFDQEFSASHYHLARDEDILMYTYYELLGAENATDQPACLIFTLKDGASFIRSCSFDHPEFFLNGTQVYLDQQKMFKTQFEKIWDMGMTKNRTKPVVENVTTTNITTTEVIEEEPELEIVANGSLDANLTGGIRRMLYRQLNMHEAELSNASGSADMLADKNIEIDFFLILYNMWKSNFTYKQFYDFEYVYYFLPEDLEAWVTGESASYISAITPAENFTEGGEEIISLANDTDLGLAEEVETVENGRRMLKHLGNKTHLWNDIKKGDLSNLPIKKWKKELTNITSQLDGLDLLIASIESMANIDLTLNNTGFKFEDFMRIYRLLSNKYKGQFKNVTNSLFKSLDSTINMGLDQFNKIFDGLNMDKGLILSVLPVKAATLFDHILKFDMFKDKEYKLEESLNALDLKVANWFKSCLFYPDHFSQNYEWLSFCTKTGLKKLWRKEGASGAMGGFEDALMGLNKPSWFLFQKDKDMKGLLTPTPAVAIEEEIVAAPVDEELIEDNEEIAEENAENIEENAEDSAEVEEETVVEGSLEVEGENN